MTSNNWDSTDLKSIDFEGWIRESLMDQIFDISRIPLPFTDLVGTGSHGNEYHSWLKDQLNKPTAGGWVVDGADAGADESQGGARYGNHSGILDKVVKVSTRARESDTIGGEALAYQIRQRQRELRQDVEANALGNQGSQESDANAGTPGIPAGFCAMATPYDTGSGGSQGGFSGGIWGPWTPGGSPVALTETLVRDAAQAAWEDGGNPSHLMSVPSVIRSLSGYMFTSSSRIATLTSQGGVEAQNREASGAVNVFLTDFNVELRFVPNRLQLPYDVAGTGDGAAVILLDPDYAEISYLHGYRVEPLAKTGLADNRQMAVDFTVVCHEPNAHRTLMDIDVAAPVTQA